MEQLFSKPPQNPANSTRKQCMDLFKFYNKNTRSTFMSIIYLFLENVQWTIYLLKHQETKGSLALSGVRKWEASAEMGQYLLGNFNVNMGLYLICMFLYSEASLQPSRTSMMELLGWCTRKTRDVC